MVDQLWDEPAFKRRVQSMAKARGISVKDALKGAGITERYFSRPQEGRSTNLILNLARFLGVTPAELMGLTEPADEQPVLDSEKLKRITVAAQMMTAQVAALVYVASDGSDADPQMLMKLVMERVNGFTQSETESGKSKK